MTGVLNIALKSDLCAGSGEAVGVSVDTDICTDEWGLPYIPARRIKGLLRKSAAALVGYETDNDEKKHFQGLMDNLFGTKTTMGALRISDAHLPGTAAMRRLLSNIQSIPTNTDSTENASPLRALKASATPQNVTRLFTSVRGQTRMSHGVADDQSLRYTRVLVRYNALNIIVQMDQKSPMDTKEHQSCPQETVLSAPVVLETDGNQALFDFFENVCKATRHLGTMLNRGLGHVSIKFVPDISGAQNARPSSQMGGELDKLSEKDKIEISYTVSLDAPVTLPGYGEHRQEIPARSVIGCVSAAWIQSHQGAEPAADREFQKLFLTGEVRWSSLTPLVNGRRSVPTPLMLIQMKNEKSDTDSGYRNLLNAKKSAVSGKRKTLDGTFSALPDIADRNSAVLVAKVHTHEVHHHSHGENGTLYVQESLDAGMLYCGTVTIPSKTEGSIETARVISQLLQDTVFRFGRSRTAQYAACSLVSPPSVRKIMEEPKLTQPGEPVYVLLESDMVLEDGVLYQADNAAVKTAIIKAVSRVDNLEDQSISLLTLPTEGPEQTEQNPGMDYCLYRTIAGYQQKWNMQKPQIPAARAGSVYRFTSNGGKIPSSITIGGYPQEGFGVCRILTQTDMERLSNIKEAAVDKAVLQDVDTGTDNTDYAARLKTALTVEAARFARREDVYTFFESEEGKQPRWNRPGLIGRLRLMLTEADSYEDLLERIRSIQTSDVVTNHGTSDQQKALDWVGALWSGKLFSLCLDENAAENGNAAHDQRTALLDLIREDQEAQQELKKHWKEPLRLLFKLAYYEEEGGRNQNGTD